MSYSSVALFLHRALSVSPAFALTDGNVPAVVEVCRRLDGIPLAIELTAARANVLAPRQLAERLDQRFRLLNVGDPSAPPRHQTMTALFDWSYALLTEREQRFFEVLSIFAGSFTLEAATAVCAPDEEDDIDVLETIASLIAKSLVCAEPTVYEQRYRFLESTRKYARNKSITRGEHDRISERHALFHLDLAERFAREWAVTPERTWLVRAKMELENWRAALEWALQKRRDVLLGQRLVAEYPVTLSIFNGIEGKSLVRSALASVDQTTPLALVARLEYARTCALASTWEREESLAAAKRALMLYKEVGDVKGTARAQMMVGSSLALLGNATEAEQLLRETLKAARRMGDRRLEANVLEKIAWARSAAGDFSDARAYFDEALQLGELMEADSFCASVLINIAEMEFCAGNPQTALRVGIDLLATYRSTHFSDLIAIGLVNVAAYLVRLGRYDEAQVRATEGLQLARDIGLATTVGLAVERLGVIAVLRQPEKHSPPTLYNGVARLFGFVQARQNALGIATDDSQKDYARALEVVRSALNKDDISDLMAAGASMTEDDAVDQAYAVAHS